jgi:hypothetical protein
MVQANPSGLSRRKTLQTAFGGLAAAAGAALPLPAVEGWTSLFDGVTLNGWKAGSNAASWSVREGQIVASGPVSHLFYVGQSGETAPQFRNFELELEALAQPAANSGVYFHTRFQPEGFPTKGFEVQINNSALGEGSYRERKRSGSLYGIRNVYQQLVRDQEWFRLAIRVQGKNIQVRLNGILVVDYLEPTPAILPPSQEKERFLDQGTFALQCHDPGSKVQFRSIRVRRLGEAESNPGPAPKGDDTFRQLISLGAKNYPLVDWHVHLKPGLGVEEALERSRRDGIYYGISANCGRQSQYRDDASAAAFVESIRGRAAFVGMQAEGADWMQVFSRKTVQSFDYIFNDGMIWTEPVSTKPGQRWTRIYRPEDVGKIDDPEAFLEEQIRRVIHLLDHTPMDIYAIPTYLPDNIGGDRQKLWNADRIDRVVAALVRNQVAVEMSGRYSLPERPFLEAARAAGCQFALGTGNSTAADLQRSEYGLRQIEELKLGWGDLFLPGAKAPRAAERRAHLLRD